jgi:type IV pilus assembly protein PilW
MKVERFKERGFTLTELLVVLALVGIVMAGIYSTYASQQKSYVTQDQVAAMQQNLRAAMYYMGREIRMAGCDPTGDANARIVNAGSATINFTLDITDNAGTGDPDGDTSDANENITYRLYDPDGDGVTDLGRDTGGGNQLVAENIDALDFVYLDASGAITATLSDIRSVQVTLVARTGRGDPGYTDSTAYQNQQGTIIYTAPGDNNRRRLLTTFIRCRNLGF